MKKLKTWQLILLIIFYPVGIVYFVVWLCKRNKQQTKSSASIDSSKMTILRDFHTKVVGVTFDNDNGTSRQEIIKNCRVGEDIILKPVPTKEYPDAIGVFNTRGQQLGYISAELAKEIKTQYPTNPMKVVIAGLTGGEENKNYGCNLHIIIYTA